jgi:hypothetical protein
MLRDRLHELRNSGKSSMKSTLSLLTSMREELGRAKYDRLFGEYERVVSEFRKWSEASIRKERSVGPITSSAPPPATSASSASSSYATLPGSSNGEADGIMTGSGPLPEALTGRQSLAQIDRQSRLRDQAVTQAELALEANRQMRVLEEDLAGLAELFQECDKLVKGQQENIDAVEDNVYKAAVHTEEGVEELQLANKHQKSARSKTCLLLLIVLCVGAAILFPVIIVLGKKKRP